jgi:hypothetical protein
LQGRANRLLRRASELERAERAQQARRQQARAQAQATATADGRGAHMDMDMDMDIDTEGMLRPPPSHPAVARRWLRSMLNTDPAASPQQLAQAARQFLTEDVRLRTPDAVEDVVGVAAVARYWKCVPVSSACPCRQRARVVSVPVSGSRSSRSSRSSCPCPCPCPCPCSR